MTALNSERLNIRHFTEADYPFIIKLLNEPSFIENVADKNIKNKSDAINYIQSNLIASYQKFGFGLNLIELKAELKSSKKPIGMCGLIKREELDDVDIGYALLSEFTGKGYAFEAAKAVLKNAKDKHQLKRVVAITADFNHQSARLLEKLNFKFEKMIEFKGNKDKFFGLSLI